MRYSIITACLNSSATLHRTIHSVFSQTTLPGEYVFVDGGSSDGTLKVIDEARAWAEANRRDLNFKVIHQTTKGGIYEAWNLALSEVTGELVCLLNSDDWYYPYTMAHVLDCFGRCADAEILLGSGLYVDGPDLK